MTSLEALRPNQLSMIPRLQDVWRTLGGPEPQGRRARAWWRDGDHLSVALDLDRNVWHDHARGVGGGVVKLVETVRGCSRRDAVEWLRQSLGWPESRLTTDQRRDYARRRAHAEKIAERVLLWHAAVLRESELVKTAAYQNYLAHPNHETEKSFATAARRNYEIQQLRGAQLARAFQDAAKGGTDFERFVALGRDNDMHAEFCTAFIVAMIATERRFGFEN